jgi:hypothetical protein
MVTKPVLRLVGTRFGTWFGVWFLRYSRDWEDEELNDREDSSELPVPWRGGVGRLEERAMISERVFGVWVFGVWVFGVWVWVLVVLVGDGDGWPSEDERERLRRRKSIGV